jgi:hypothetical protein
MRFKPLLLALSASAFLVACSGGSDEPVIGAVANLSVAASSANTAAVVGQTFGFPAGVADFGTTAATSLSINAPAAGSTAPGFGISSGGATASGTLNFGSCIFVIGTSTFPAASPLAAGKTVTVNPCNINAATAGKPANGTPTPTNVTIVLGATTSNPQVINVSVNPNGSVTVNNVTTGSVATGTITGGG